MLTNAQINAIATTLYQRPITTSPLPLTEEQTADMHVLFLEIQKRLFIGAYLEEQYANLIYWYGSSPTDIITGSTK